MFPFASLERRLTVYKVSPHKILPLFKSTSHDVYQFVFPDSEFCTPFCCDFAHSAHEGHLVAIGDEEGRLSLLRTDKDNHIHHSQYHHSFYCHRHGISDVKWSQDDTMLLTASHDRLVRLWDTETRSSLADFVGHDDVVKSVNWHPYNEHLLVTGSKDGSFRIWDTRFNQKPAMDSVEDGPSAPVYNCITAISNAHDYGQNTKTTRTSHVEPNIIRSVTCALFVNREETKVISSGSADGSIKLWDIRTCRSAQALESTVFESEGGRRYGVTDLKMDRSGTRLLSACKDNSIYMHYLVDLTKPATRLTDPEFKLGGFDIRISISADDHFVMAGSDDKDIFVWELDAPKRQPFRYEGHTRKVTGVSWSKFTTHQFASCSEDFTARIWNFGYSD
ncbi:hypothetical protein G6F52_010378 [Rhizopus delemar]|nr:hypothetical protein G6F52_010378 [Rhizopus delemar]